MIYLSRLFLIVIGNNKTAGVNVNIDYVIKKYGLAYNKLSYSTIDAERFPVLRSKLFSNS